MRYRSIGICFTILCAVAQTVHAQDESLKTIIIDETLLKQLYERQLRYPDDTYIQKRIADERGVIGDFIEEELQKIVTPPVEEIELDASEFPKAIDRQKNVVAGLEDRLRERKVDLDLLQTEEKKYYLDPRVGTGVLTDDKFRLTRSHEGLLAKKAIIEERIAVVELLLHQQKSRYDKLLVQQRLQHFSLFISIGKYLLVIFFVWFLEAYIRRKYLSQIHDAEKRYTITKVFSSVTYVMLFGWLIATLFAKQPGILASFAIVGAGIAIALQDVVKDILGWMVILQHRLFSTGDRITIGEYTGEVVDINMLRVTLLEVGLPPNVILEHTGKILSLPNALVLTQAITNHSKTSDFVNAEMHITITFESNSVKAKAILGEVLQEETLRFTEAERIQYMRRTRSMYVQRQISGPAVYMEISADGVNFILHFSTPIGERRSVVTKLSECILARFNEEDDITLAYKTIRYYKEGEGRSDSRQ